MVFKDDKGSSGDFKLLNNDKTVKINKQSDMTEMVFLFGVKHGRNEFINTVLVRFYAGEIGLNFTADNFS